MKKLRIYNQKDFPSHLPKLNTLYKDLFSGGKDLRSMLVQKIASHLELKKEEIFLLSQTIEFIHNASLLHDDLVDSSPLRRSKKAAWLKYTPEYAVLAGDYLLTRVMVNLSEYGNLFLIQYTAKTISNLIEGEWIQDTFLKNWNLELKDWDEVHRLKTSSLFKWCLRAPFICARIEDKVLHNTLSKIGDIFGLLFQRSDDLLDFGVRNYEKKSLLEDMKSGYLNSFGVFLQQQINEEKRERFRCCKNVEDLHDLMGKSFFEERVSEFDEMNKELITSCKAFIFSFKKFPQFVGKGLIDTLLKALHLLYWRRFVS